MVRPIVIVHGAYLQPAHYEALAEKLRTTGATVTVPDIGQLLLSDSTPLIQRIVDESPEPPVVVGHSFGGAAVGGVSGAHAYVFLSAWILDDGETCNTEFAAVPKDVTPNNEFMDALGPIDDGKLFVMDPTKAGDVLFNDSSLDVQAWAISLLRPDIAANFEQAPPRGAFYRTAPSVYVTATEDHTWTPWLRERYAARTDKNVTIKAAHDMFLSRTDETAAIIERML